MTTKPNPIARVCHEANRAYALEIGEDPQTVWPHWEEAPAAIQKSAITGVVRALDGATPEQLHKWWLESKRADGWIFVHPCMVPYAELRLAQRTKDRLFFGIVKALA